MAEPPQIIYTIASLILMGFFSGMEAVLASMNRFQVESEKKQGGTAAKITAFFTENQILYTHTLTVGYYLSLATFVVLGLPTVFSSGWVYSQYVQHPLPVLIFLLVLLGFFAIVIGEYLPRSIFRILPARFLTLLTFLAFLFYWLLYPVAKIMAVFSRMIYGRHESKNLQPFSVWDRADLNSLVKEATEGHRLDSSEIDHEFFILKNALEFPHTKVRDCMVPRTEIVAVEADTDIETLRLKFVETGLSKILVYEKNIDQIIGYVHSFALFKSPQNIRSVMIAPLIVPESMPVSSILREFTGRRKSMAVVVDEFGGTAGILTIEDVMEEIFGEIEDEHDSEQLTDHQISETEFLLSGRLEIHHLREKYGLPIPESDEYSTLAGYIIHQYENLPEEGERINMPDFDVWIEKRQGGKIDEVRLLLKLD